MSAQLSSSLAGMSVVTLDDLSVPQINDLLLKARYID